MPPPQLLEQGQTAVACPLPWDSSCGKSLALFIGVQGRQQVNRTLCGIFPLPVLSALLGISPHSFPWEQHALKAAKPQASRGVSKWHWSSRVHGSWCVAGQKKSHSQPLLVTTLCFLSSPLGKSWQLLL